MKKVIAWSNQAKKSFGAYGPQRVVQVQQLGECPAGRLLLALQQQFITAWRFDGSGTPCLNWPRLETCISVQLSHKGLGLCLGLKEDIYQKITWLMELSDLCLREARNWINRDFGRCKALAKPRPKSGLGGCSLWLGRGGFGGQRGGGWLAELGAEKSGLTFRLNHLMQIINPSRNSTKIRIAHRPLAERGKVNRRLIEVDIPK